MLRITLPRVALAVCLIGSPPGLGYAQSNFELIPTEPDQTISLTVGAGQLIRVGEDFTSLFVADPEVADVQVQSRRLLYLTGVGVGETTLFAVDDEERVLMSAAVHVTHNLQAMQRGIAAVAPGQSVATSSVEQSIIVSGTVTSPAQADAVVRVVSQFVDDPARIVNRMAIALPSQVNLQVRIAEVSRTIDRQLGIRWNELSFDLGGTRIGLAGGRGGGVDPNRYQLGIVGSGPVNIDVVIEALAEEGLVAILAEPNLTARSGEPASFLAGGEFPFQVIQEPGVVTIEFKQFGVQLNFTPTVLSDSRISLTVGTEVSDLAPSGPIGVPSLRTRRAETTVDLGSGQSFAIAGLMENTSATDFSSLPGLGSIPILGALFRSSGFRRGQTELVIIVTPVIVQPTAADRLQTPVDGYVPPNDFERILFGRFQGDAARVDAARDRIRQHRLHGSAGFIFE